MVGLSPLLLEELELLVYEHPISKDVLTLFDKSGSFGIVMLAVIVYGH